MEILYEYVLLCKRNECMPNFLHYICSWKCILQFTCQRTYLLWHQIENYLLKYGFCKKSLRKNESLTSWTLLDHFFSRSVFNCSEFHFSKVTSYKIHTLRVRKKLWCLKFSKTCSWRFLRSNRLVQLESQLGKNNWDLKITLRKN